MPDTTKAEAVVLDDGNLMAQIHLPCIGRVLIIQLTHGYPVKLGINKNTGKCRGLFPGKIRRSCTRYVLDSVFHRVEQVTQDIAYSDLQISSF
ncbi:hypothetical protein DKX38_006946 [Salix brachista]|uniref:Uncharacterized protein n=1 Tax=Salix brachista TaxID=2182728 RepID=A0A5N5MM27_9ROSI|nr:hypothetical protein DKX38_006946 [Salix brachista]